MKAEIISISGEKLKEIELPSFFSDEIREDIVQKVFEAQKIAQPYGPDVRAGRKHSASGTIRHIRHKWRSAYGRGISRIPRKTMWRRGTQFYWIGAEISGTRGGRRAHGPKILHFIHDKKINRKELIIALKSAIASTCKEEAVAKRYGTFNGKLKKLPFVIESKVSTSKTKDLEKLIGKVLGDNKGLAEKNKTLRSGRGKLRGRKYKSSQGLLIVTGNEETLKTKIFDSKKVNELMVGDFYPLGRITFYTESAIKDLANIGIKKSNKEKAQ